MAVVLLVAAIVLAVGGAMPAKNAGLGGWPAPVVLVAGTASGVGL